MLSLNNWLSNKESIVNSEYHIQINLRTQKKMKQEWSKIN
jgi:hypothetical protein